MKNVITRILLGVIGSFTILVVCEAQNLRVYNNATNSISCNMMSEDGKNNYQILIGRKDDSCFGNGCSSNSIVVGSYKFFCTERPDKDEEKGSPYGTKEYRADPLNMTENTYLGVYYPYSFKDSEGDDFEDPND